MGIRNRARAVRLVDGLSLAAGGIGGLVLLVAAFVALARPIEIAPVRVAPSAPVAIVTAAPAARIVTSAHVRLAGVAHRPLGVVHRHGRDRRPTGAANVRPHARSRSVARLEKTAPASIAAPIVRAPIVAAPVAARAPIEHRRVRRTEAAAPKRVAHFGHPAPAATRARSHRAKAPAFARRPTVPEPPLGYDARPELVGASVERAAADATASQRASLEGLRVRGRAIPTPAPVPTGNLAI